MPAAKLKRGDGTLDYRVLDQRAMELLLSAQGYTLEQAYQQARDEQKKPLAIRKTVWKVSNERQTFRRTRFGT